MARQKLLVQSQGSDKDPKFSEQSVFVSEAAAPQVMSPVPFRKFFKLQGIKLLEKDLINSCHGDTKLTLGYAEQIQALADAGHKVVAVQQGGLYFAKPSLEAANMPTVPVISIPLDGGNYGGLDAFLAPQIPTGTAVIGGVGVANYSAAAHVAAEILANDFEGVYLYGEAPEKLVKTLDALGVPILGSTEREGNSKSGLVIGCFDILNMCSGAGAREFEETGLVGIFSPTKNSRPEAATYLMEYCKGLSKSVYVRGEENLAYFAAKVISANDTRVFKNLKEAARKKSESYERRTITLDDFTLSGE